MSRSDREYFLHSSRRSSNSSLLNCSTMRGISAMRLVSCAAKKISNATLRSTPSIDHHISSGCTLVRGRALLCAELACDPAESQPKELRSEPRVGCEELRRLSCSWCSCRSACRSWLRPRLLVENGDESTLLIDRSMVAMASGLGSPTAEGYKRVKHPDG